MAVNVSWNQLSMPYLVACGGVAIASGATLAIVPRMLVKFAGNCSCSSLLGLSVSGKLVINGTAAQPITFTSFTDDANSGWQGIFFNSGASGSISNANLRFGGLPNTFVSPTGMVYITSGNSLVSVSNNT